MRHFKICHTSDWHLGHTLRGHSRELEHEAFLRFLLDLIEREAVDALIVPGDVFDSANPPASAQSMLYRFFADARSRMSELEILVTAGNHDSAARLSAAAPILESVGVRVVGTNREPMVVPLHDRAGRVAAQVAAVPYLRPSDLPRTEGGSLVEGVRAVYDAALAEARARQEPGQALIAMGHCHMVDAAQSEQSERKILRGVRSALPADIFGDEVDYVALGHLHLAQEVRPAVHYCGSPIPLSMPEEAYTHQVRIVSFVDGRLAEQRAHPVPRLVDVFRVPADGPGTLSEVLVSLRGLVAADAELADVELARRPFVDVRVCLDEPVPDLRQQVEDALEGRAVRLVNISVSYSGVAGALADTGPRRQLGDLTVEQVFRQAYARRFEGAPDDALLRAFHEIAEVARGQIEESGP